MSFGLCGPDQTPSSRSHLASTYFTVKPFGGLDKVARNGPCKKSVVLISSSLFETLHCSTVVFGAKVALCTILLHDISKASSHDRKR